MSGYGGLASVCEVRSYRFSNHLSCYPFGAGIGHPARPGFRGRMEKRGFPFLPYRPLPMDHTACGSSGVNLRSQLSCRGP